MTEQDKLALKGCMQTIEGILERLPKDDPNLEEDSMIEELRKREAELECRNYNQGRSIMKLQDSIYSLKRNICSKDAIIKELRSELLTHGAAWCPNECKERRDEAEKKVANQQLKIQELKNTVQYYREMFENELNVK